MKLEEEKSIKQEGLMIDR
ncbi:hypothetical protein ALC53_04272 [Atta colombica]|uniref:Uncharacterized protein n=1 Tax=Atta colombica TaxID=520822 RepID=A0A151I535_9HYME|nr:hypothetical protein ALC53_04272 [Atta colombica]